MPQALVARYEAALPSARAPGPIPKIIHQTYFTADLPPLLADNAAALRAANPGWSYRFYDDADIDTFVRENYGPGVYRTFKRIAASYGVVRADLFRYMVVYVLGGVYLDIKSSFKKPIDEVLTRDEGFVVSHWDNGQGEPHEGWGQHPELHDLPLGEIQQWHVIAASGHPFLRRVIATILARIEAYRPWRDNVGWLGVITLSGPIVYTRAITPLLPDHRHTEVRDQRRLGLVYSVMPQIGHKTFFKGHYVENHRPVVTMPFYLEPLSRGYAWARKWNRRRLGKRISER